MRERLSVSVSRNSGTESETSNTPTGHVDAEDSSYALRHSFMLVVVRRHAPRRVRGTEGAGGCKGRRYLGGAGSRSIVAVYRHGHTHVPVPHERTREKTGGPPPTDYSLLMRVHRLVSCSALVLLLIELLPDVCCCE